MTVNMLTAIHYTPQRGWTDVNDLSEISQLCEVSGERVWAEVDVSTLDARDIATIAEEFELHDLAVEDAISMKERPKLEEYGEHLFVVVHELEDMNGQLEPIQVACFVGTRWVLALHAGATSIMDETKRRLRATTDDVWGGSAYLMHTLLDTIVDDYQHIADDLEATIERLEETILADPRAPAQTALYTVKQRLARFRRYVLPVSRMIGNVTEQGAFAPSIAVVDTHFGAYFRDIHDHTLRITDQVRNVEDLADALIDLTRVEATNAQNEVTKRLTGWAAIIAVPTYIASVYGMNFELVPKSGQVFGFWFAIGLMASTAVSLYVFFRRRNWI